MRYRKLLLMASMPYLATQIGVCRAEPIGSNNGPALLFHSQAPAKLLTKDSDTKKLLVGIAPYLGEIDNSDLLLKSPGAPLTLKDSTGFQHSSTEITVTWKRFPLDSSLMISRQVVGPFASFESAERVALKLKELNIPNVIANPKDWEVWVAKDIKLPKEVAYSKYEEMINSEIRPVLKIIGQNEKKLVGPLEIISPQGIKWKNAIYLGPFLLQPNAYGTWTLIESVPIERYLRGVVPYEIGHSAPFAALSAQAVLARTWALANSHRFHLDGYNLCNNTQCQVYKDPGKANDLVQKAIFATKGKIISWENRPINAVYHANNGGIMASVDEAWSVDKVPYLISKLDGTKSWSSRFKLPFNNNFLVLNFLSKDYKGVYGENHRLFRWTRTASSKEIKKHLNSALGKKFLPKAVEVLNRGSSGRVLSLELRGQSNEARTVLKLDEIRRVLRFLPSTLFVVKELKDGLWQFSGGGFGHGAGLSQSGAIDLALRGWNVSEILKHYYPGTTYGILQELPKAP